MTKLIKSLVALSLMSLTTIGVINHAQSTPAQAKARQTRVLKYTNVKATKVHAKKGYLYRTANLTKKVHNVKNYRHTTFTTTKKALVKKTNGKTTTYRYITNGKVKGWIWYGYVKKGYAAKSVKSYAIIMNRYVLGTELNNSMASFTDSKTYSQLGNNLNNRYYPVDSQAQYTKSLNALNKIHKLFANQFSKNVNKNLTAMIKKAKSDGFTAMHDSSQELETVRQSIAAEISSVK